MVPALLLFLTFSLMWVEIPVMRRRNQTGELVAFSVIWLLGLVLGLMVVAGVPTNQVTELLRHIFEPIAKTFLKPPPA